MEKEIVFELMRKDEPISKVIWNRGNNTVIVTDICRSSLIYIPTDSTEEDLKFFLNSRIVPQRSTNTLDIIKRTRGFKYGDNIWIKFENDHITWDGLNKEIEKLISM